ncbi:MAG: ribonuclease HII [Lachnospiraceae bacterium]|nr:ribonuclease HII [Lachnospiraceae bacterium]
MEEVKSIGVIREELQAAASEQLPDFITAYEKDGRTSVQKLVAQAENRVKKLKAERQRIWELGSFEREYGAFGYVCGVDEAGRGPLAGPVVAGAVILPGGCDILYINDSKKLSEKKREELYDVILKQAVAVGVGMASPRRIDEVNILNATYEAMQEAIQKLSQAPDILLNDAVTIPGISILQVPIIKGDAKSISIGAASIIAKVTRDRIMEQYHKEMPEYGFASNKGYGTKDHIQALKTYGACPIHRASFIQKFLNS